ncbi:D-amino-acid N-acetyltransferase [Pestalotiopsis sp. 9143b]|nr:D-amino-acid N-acetyltransferase [Pestalotiopsis sp. 9143b]
MSVTIRPVTKEDEPQWREHWESYNQFYKRTIPEEVTATTFARFLDASVPMHCAVAVSSTSPDDKIAGFATWFPHMSTSSVAPKVYLNDLFVDPSARCGGVGGRLIDHVVDHARDVLGADSVYWLTQHFNHAAQLLYVKKATKSDFVHYTKKL